MRDGWVEATLGQLVTLEYGRALREADRDGGVYPVIGSAGVLGSHSVALVQRGPVIIVGRKGNAGAVHWSDRPAWPIDTTYWVKPRVDIELRFLRILLEFLDLPSVCAQTGVPGLTRNRAYEMPVLLPKRADQRRIVDVVESIDSGLLCAMRFDESAACASDAIIEGWLALNADSPTRAMGDLTEMASGPSWKAADERNEPSEGVTPVLGITNTPVGDELDLSAIGYVAGLRPNTRLLTESSLLMIRTNGNRARIGNVYRVSPEAAGKAYSAFQIGVFPNDPADRDVIYWQLRAPSFQRSITAAASGTTGLGNIAISWLKRLELPWPGEEDRANLVEAANAMRELRISAKRETERLGELRRGVLADLLSGEHEIPESYDVLLDEAAVA